MLYTYDSEVDVLYVSLLDDEGVAIARTIELGPNLHVDVDDAGSPIGVEVLYPRTERVDLSPVKDRFGVGVPLPFDFVA